MTADTPSSVDALLADWIDRRPLPSNLREAIRYSLFAGGKRMRPMLVIRACVAVGGEEGDAMAAAGAIEMVHSFSLIHDDLPCMDDADLRRGRPTLHKATNELMAVLAGDALSSLAFELLSGSVRPYEKAGQLCEELSVATNDMIAGQVYDTEPAAEDSLPPQEHLERIHRNKTGALIRCACRMGAICGNATKERLEALTIYGERIGLMFQVVDDLLDETQTTEHLGKDAGRDQARGKLTYPGLYGLEESREVVERLQRESLEVLAPMGEAADPLRDLCERMAKRTR